MEASVGGGIDSRSLESRIERMHQRDRRGALAFVLGLWVTVLFALFTIWPMVSRIRRVEFRILLELP